MVTVDASGARGRDAATLPAPLAQQLRRISAEQELVVDAALSGDRALVRDAMFLDPLAGRIDDGELARMTDELLQATSAWLPQFR